MTLTDSGAPTLPVVLPFTLSDAFIVREKFHLDQLGRYRQVQIKITNSSSNTDDIKIYNINLVAFPEEYRNE